MWRKPRKCRKKRVQPTKHKNGKIQKSYGQCSAIEINSNLIYNHELTIFAKQKHGLGGPDKIVNSDKTEELLSKNKCVWNMIKWMRPLRKLGPFAAKGIY